VCLQGSGIIRDERFLEKDKTDVSKEEAKTNVLKPKEAKKCKKTKKPVQKTQLRY